MFRLTIRELWAHKLRFALTGLAVVLGVAFMTGTMVLTDTMGKTFDDLFEMANADVDVVVRQPETIQTEFGGVRERVPAETLEAVRSVEGVEVAAGSVEGFAQLVNADGTTASTDGLGITIGANWVDDRVNAFSLTSGHAPEGPTDAVLDEGTVESQGWEIGDSFSVLTQVGPRELSLVGTAALGDLKGLPGSSLVAVADAPAQEMFGQPGFFESVVISGDGIDTTVLADRIDESLGTGAYDVATGEENTQDQQDQFREDLSFFSQFLMAFAYVSLFVGVFIIHNTFSIVVAQRKQEYAMLRAIGASRRQILRSVMFESVAVGLVASAVGLAGGVVMSMGLRMLLGAVGVDIPTGALVISTATVVTAFAVGLFVTVQSAIGPARQAGRVKPMAALRDVHDDTSATSRTRLLGGLLLTGAGAFGFARGVISDAPDAIQMLGLGSAAILVGVLVLGPVIARPVVRVIGWPAARISGMVGRLAKENAVRNPKRTAATASALMIGVALVGFITIVASSTNESISVAIDRSMQADYVVESGSFGEGGFSTGLATEIAQLPEVDAVSPMRSTPVEVDGSATELQAFDMLVLDRLFDFGVTSGTLDAVGDGEVAVTAKVAASKGLGLGDTVDLEFPAGPASLTVAAVFEDPVVGAGDDVSYLVDTSTFEAHVTDQFDRQIYVLAASGSSAAESRDAIEAAVVDQPNADLQDQAQFKESITSQIDRMLNLIYGLLALAVVIALIGIANTLALSVHERTRELGLLRAVGMTRGQVRSAIRWESVLIALLGTGLGALLAIGGAWGIVRGLGSEGVTSFVVPPVQMTAIIGLAALAGVVAALGPARRASRLNVLSAIATQ